VREEMRDNSNIITEDERPFSKREFQKNRIATKGENADVKQEPEVTTLYMQRGEEPHITRCHEVKSYP
jgi:hypothetical protein